MPLVSNPKYADEVVAFDVHNLVGRCEKGPAGVFRNKFGYPTTAIDIGISKIRAVANHVGLAKGARVCLSFSADENSDVRRRIYPQYKSGRVHEEPEQVVIGGTAAEPVVRTHDGVRDLMEVMHMLPSLHMSIPNNDGETDDALATFSVSVGATHCTIVTEDRDLWQTMSDHVDVISKPDKIFSVNDIAKKYGIYDPRKVPLVKALYGDDSDKIDKAVSQVTPNVVGHLVMETERVPGEYWFTPAFMRLLRRDLVHVHGQQATLYQRLLDREDQVLFLEKLTRLRRLKLTYTQGKRDLTGFAAALRWYEIDKKFDSFMTFAQS